MVSDNSAIYIRTKEFERHYDELNTIRIKNAEDAMSENGRVIFSSIALYLHYNHPLIPGYVVGDVPHGISGFIPNETQKNYLYSLSSASGVNQEFINVDESIIAVYCMGSTSSVGQGPKSDIDVWVCVSHHLSDERIVLLEKKCSFITEMSAKRGVEVNFFIVKDNKFKEPNIDSADKESCGSAQHMFLLDEFYRSSIYLAGKKLVWMVVPESEEYRYDDYVNNDLFKSGILSRDQWFDLGSVSGISSEEYYGSALWLLYKSIDSPFKAVLKILLMEVYSSEYPQTKLLSMEMRNWMQNNEGYSLKLDSYYMVYEKIIRYLKNHDEEKRMSLVQFCFYQKLYDGIRKIENTSAMTYRRSVIRGLLESWGWSKEERNFMDNRQKWRLAEIIRIYNLVFNNLMQSYQALLSFGIVNKVSDAIKLVDISVLSRKLFIAFDSYTGKIKNYNLNFANSLIEKNVSFVEVKNSHVCRDGWYVFKKSLETLDVVKSKPLMYFNDLANAIATVVENGLIGDNTAIEVHSKNPVVSEKKIRKISDEIKSFFGENEHVSNDTLLNPEFVKKALFIINATDDGTVSSDYHHVASGVRNVNVFTSGKKSQSMVSSIIVILQNTWNEKICLNYEGKDCVIDFISDFDKFFHRGADTSLIQTKVVNCSAHMWAYINTQMESLVDKLLQGVKNPENSVIDIKINNDDYVVWFDKEHTTIFSKYLYESIKQSEERYEEHIPSIVSKNLNYGCVQFFFAYMDSGLVDIYELNENNELKTYKNFIGDVEELVKDINLYYSKKITVSNNQENKQNIEQKKVLKQYFNLPQFYIYHEGKDDLSPFYG